MGAVRGILVQNGSFFFIHAVPPSAILFPCFVFSLDVLRMSLTRKELFVSLCMLDLLSPLRSSCMLPNVQMKSYLLAISTSNSNLLWVILSYLYVALRFMLLSKILLLNLLVELNLLHFFNIWTPYLYHLSDLKSTLKPQLIKFRL